MSCGTSNQKDLVLLSFEYTIHVSVVDIGLTVFGMRAMNFQDREMPPKNWIFGKETKGMIF